MVRKNHPNQCTYGVIACVEQCTEAVQMNWSLFLLNELMEDGMLVQEGNRTFNYSWLFILNALLKWMEPKYYQGMEVQVSQE